MLVRTLATLLLFAVTTAPAFADSAIDVGALAAVAYGQHVGFANPVPVNGVVPAAIIEATQYVNAIRLHVEGIPTVTASGYSGGAFGNSSARISLLDALLMVDVDSKRRFRLGGGVQTINLSNYSGYNGSTNDAHLANVVYAAGSTLPMPRQHFLEFNLYVLPNVRTNLLVFSPTGVAQPTEPEQGAEVYYSGQYGWHRGRNTFLLGFAGLNYHTRNTNTGGLVDRNVGGALTFEYRYRFGSLPLP
jgi:hypothetical protein